MKRKAKLILAVVVLLLLLAAGAAYAAAYRCTRCGFGAKLHHWQCPSCKTWGSVRPIYGTASE